MNLFRLSIKDNGSDRINQVLDYVDIWNGQEGLTEIKDGASIKDFEREIGSFVTGAVVDDDTITGVLAYGDDMYDFIDGIILDRDGYFKKVTRLMQDTYFDLAIMVIDTLKSVNPYEDYTVFEVLERLHNDMPGTVSGLCGYINKLVEK